MASSGMSRWVRNKPTNWSRFKAGKHSAMIYFDSTRSKWAYRADNYEEQSGRAGSCDTLEEAKAICDRAMGCGPHTQPDLFA